jgi:hypothetical protein
VCSEPVGPEPESHLDHFLSRGVSVAKTSSVISRKVRRNHRIRRIQDRLVFNEIAEV